VAHLALEHAPETQDAGEIEKHNGVTGFETQVQRAAIVAIDDPRGATDKLSDLSAPLLRRCRLPPSSPVEGIEVDERESTALGQPSSDGGLPRSTGADYENAFQSGDGEAAASVKRWLGRRSSQPQLKGDDSVDAPRRPWRLPSWRW